MTNSDGTKPFLKALNTSGLHVTADKVLIEPTKVEEKTKGGIVLASASLEKEELAQVIGTVIAVGGTCDQCPEMEGIGPGDLVLYARYSGAEFPVDGICYQIVRARDILGKASRLPDSILRGAESSKNVFGVNEQAA